MGLDSIEILMKVEDSFGIRIPDQEAQQIITVGDFHNAVWRQLSGRSSDVCQSQRLFYTLRRTFAEKTGFPSRQITLETVPQVIFPARNRRQKYLAFSETSNLKLPALVLEKFWSSVLTTFGIAAIIGSLAASILLVNVFNYSKWMFIMPVAGIVLTVMFSDLLASRRTVISAASMRDFTQQVLALNYSSLSANEGTNQQEMQVIINHIIADMVGMDVKEISPDKKIADDLGID